MNSREWQVIQDLEARVAALEAERVTLDRLMEHCSATLRAIDECREDFRGLPRYGLRFPRIGQLPGGVAQALAHRGYIPRVWEEEGAE
jgi:hypothetical protein